MTFHDRLREWFGINEALRAARHNHDLLLAISDRLGDTQTGIKRTNTQLGAILPAISRIVAKLDTQFARDPQSPAMKAESDKLTEETIRRLEAEQAVRDHYGYTPKE